MLCALRFEGLAQNSKTVAYFCRYYAVEQAMGLRQGNDPEITQFLTALYVVVVGVIAAAHS